MRVVSGGRLSRVALPLVAALVATFAGLTPAHAGGNTQLLSNGGFETGGGSLTGWSSVHSKLSLASDGDGGGRAALATLRSGSAATYGLTTTSPPVTGAPAGESFNATGKIRSATPGRTVCLVLRELTSGGSLVQTRQQCGVATAAWASLPVPTTLTVGASGHSVSLRVTQSSGASGDSFEADSLSLLDTDTTAPSVPTGVTAVASSSSAVDLSWSPSTDADGGGVGGYDVYRGTSKIATLGASATTYRDATVAASSSYSYTIIAFDFAKNYSASSSAAAVTTPAPPADVPPTVPGGVSASAASSSQVNVSWTASTDTDSTGVAGYTVYRGGTAIANVNAPATSYADTTVSPATSYSYTVSAFDTAQNNSAASSAATVTTPAATTDNPPTVPSGVSASAVSSSQVNVSWTASTDTDSTGVAGYTVYRDGTTIATVSAPATSYLDASVSPATSYSYTVAAFDTAQNNSAASSPVVATTPPAPTTGVIDDLWHMNETSGTTMVDSGATPHPGVLHNIALGQAGDPAFSGTSYGFNGTSSGIDVGSSDDLNAGTKDVHIALSLNTTTVPPTPDYDLFRKGEYPGTEYKLELQTNGQFSCEFRTLQANGTVVGFTIQPAIDLHDGVWHRLTCSKVGGTMTVTVDGVAFTKSITGSISNTYHLVIGSYNPAGTSDNYQGRLDEVSFHIG